MMKRFLLISLATFCGGVFLSPAQGRTVNSTLAHAQGLLMFYAAAFAEIAKNGDELSSDDFNGIYQHIKIDIHSFVKKNPNSRWNSTLLFILSELGEHKLNTSRWSSPALWLNEVSETLKFSASTINSIIDQQKKEKGDQPTTRQIQIIHQVAFVDGFIRLIQPHLNHFHGSYIFVSPLSHQKMVKPYLAQLVNIFSSNGGPQLKNPIDDFRIDASLRQAANLQFQLKNKANFYVSSL